MKNGLDFETERKKFTQSLTSIPSTETKVPAQNPRPQWLHPATIPEALLRLFLYCSFVWWQSESGERRPCGCRCFLLLVVIVIVCSVSTAPIWAWPLLSILWSLISLSV